MSVRKVQRSIRIAELRTPQDPLIWSGGFLEQARTKSMAPQQGTALPYACGRHRVHGVCCRLTEVFVTSRKTSERVGRHKSVRRFRLGLAPLFAVGLVVSSSTLAG